MKEFRIDRHHAGKRLDRFMEEMEHWPHGMVVKAVRMKKLKVNGKKEDRTYRLCEGDRVVSYVLPKEKRRDFTIVYEDEHILIADKKAGLLCMDSTGKTTRTLIGEVNEYLADKGEPSAYMVHRIDFNTSGLMVIAKDEESKGILDRMIKKFISVSYPGFRRKRKDTSLIIYLRMRNREKYFCLMFRKKGRSLLLQTITS